MQPVFFLSFLTNHDIMSDSTWQLQQKRSSSRYNKENECVCRILICSACQSVFFLWLVALLASVSLYIFLSFLCSPLRSLSSIQPLNTGAASELPSGKWASCVVRGQTWGSRQPAASSFSLIDSPNCLGETRKFLFFLHTNSFVCKWTVSFLGEEVRRWWFKTLWHKFQLVNWQTHREDVEAFLMTAA